MAEKKTYRPKAGADNLTVEIGIPDTETGGKTLRVSSWPYETDDPVEQALLGNHPLVTDRPEPKKKED